MRSGLGFLMTPHETMLALAQMFREAGHAHHRAFLAANGDDPDWPTWYAQYLAPRMEALLGRAFDVPQLARQLDDLENRRKQIHPLPDWPLFYAEDFLSTGK